jgi:radical SAM-linked protein
MIQQKIEVRFEKTEALRFISHHDLMRAFQRAVRRAGLPVRLTEGFNPRPRIVFPMALEVGVASLDEVAEIELTQCLTTQELARRLSAALPPGLVFKTVKEIPPFRAARTPTRLLYRLHLREAGIRAPAPAVAALLAAATLPFVRSREKSVQNVDLRPALLVASLETSGDLLLAVRPAPKGSARPLELLSLLLQAPLQKLKHVRVTKLRMDLS